ncbi:unnamed protein product [Gongylonema pulchrum]|uniref:Biogenesis of lysosome-related organelles complex 1 subunit 5 n=1 Tax=Gongylonema pulchrum TaxID=637853 RepID=A0A183E6Y0_9BILA|nr:unnamed protein product [Gongylonema pulchrum]
MMDVTNFHETSRKVLKQCAENNNIVQALMKKSHFQADFMNLLDVMEDMRQKWDEEKSRADALQAQLNKKESDYR